jgi:hypothetical protein
MAASRNGIRKTGHPIEGGGREKSHRFTAYVGSMMKVPSRIFIATVLPARPLVFLRTRHFMSVFEVFHIPSTTLHEFSKLPDSFASCRLTFRELRAIAYDQVRGTQEGLAAHRAAVGYRRGARR